MIAGPKRWKHFAVTALIGDGVMALVSPRRDAKAWECGPAPWCRLMRALQDRPGMTRAIGVAQIAGGVWWLLAEERRRED